MYEQLMCHPHCSKNIKKNQADPKGYFQDKKPTPQIAGIRLPKKP